MIRTASRMALIAVLAALSAAGRAVPDTGATSPTPQALRAAFYSYDTSLPLNASVKPLPTTDPRLAAIRDRFYVTYESVHDQRVTAIYTVPHGKTGPFPAVILLHGSGGNKDVDYIQLTANMLAGIGCATISIDSQYHGDRARPGRSGDIHMIDQDTMRDAWIQTVVDLRRAVDFLQSRKGEVDGSRIGFIGFSQGGMIGGTFIGVEPRIKVACLAVAGGGFIAWSKVVHIWSNADAAKLAVNAWITDPVHFIGAFAGRPLLFLNAKEDELIAPIASHALQAAAGEPKEIKWYNSGHVIPPTAILVDAKAFFLKNLVGKEGPKSK